MKVLIQTSVGELVDKITILELKALHLRDAIKLENVKKELKLLESKLTELGIQNVRFEELRQGLGAVNSQIWVIEDQIRDQERKGLFGDDFIKLARSVYKKNDDRARIKREINELLGSEPIEEKSYQHY